MKDYAKFKALCQEMIECIGDEPEGGDGTDKTHKKEEHGEMSPHGIADIEPAADTTHNDYEKKDKRKGRKDDAIATMAAVLAAKHSK